MGSQAVKAPASGRASCSRLRPQRRGLFLFAAALTVGLLGCESLLRPDGGRDPAVSSEPTFLRIAATAPGTTGGGGEVPPKFSADGQDGWLRTFEKSFEACRGTAETVEFRYTETGEGEDARQVFLRFELGPETLHRYPDGSRFRAGDCVTIGIEVDRELMIARYEPSGLRFDPDAPARIRVDLSRVDRDYDRDGEEDPEMTSQIRIWRQEADDEPWVEMPTDVDAERSVVESVVTGFTRYAGAV